MDESLTQQLRVRDECLRIVSLCWVGRKVNVLISIDLTVPFEEAPANYVPAAAVIRRAQALFGFTGRKASVGGKLSQKFNLQAQPAVCF